MPGPPSGCLKLSLIMASKGKRNPELNRLYFAVGLGVLIWVIFRCYRILSAQVESGIDAPSRWALLALGLANVLAIGTLLFIVARSLAKLYFERRSGILGARIRTRLVVALFMVGLVPSLMLFLIGRTFIRKNVDRWFLPDTQQVIQDGRRVAEAYRAQLRPAPAQRAARHIPPASAQDLDRLRRDPDFDLVARPRPGPAARGGGRPEPGPARWSRCPRDREPATAAGNGTWTSALPNAAGAPAGGRGSSCPGRPWTGMVRLERRYQESFQISTGPGDPGDPAPEHLPVPHHAHPVRRGVDGPGHLPHHLRARARPGQGRPAGGPRRPGGVPARGGRGRTGLPVPQLQRHDPGPAARTAPPSRPRPSAWSASGPTWASSWRPCRWASSAGSGPGPAHLQLGGPALAGRGRTGTLRARPGRSCRASPAAGGCRTWCCRCARPAGPTSEELRIGGEGEGRPVRAVVIPLTGGGELAVLEDLSLLAQAEKRAAWQEVARRMAHEVKNPLTPIKLTTQRLLRRAGKGGWTPSPWPRGPRPSWRRWPASPAWWTASRASPSCPRPSRSALDAVELVRQTMALFVPTHARIAWELDLPERPLEARWDGDMVKRALLNMVDNAIGALESRGRIRPAGSGWPCARTAPRPAWKWPDDGPGVPEESRQHLFDPTSPPSSGAPAWAWPSSGGSPRTTAARPLRAPGAGQPVRRHAAAARGGRLAVRVTPPAPDGRATPTLLGVPGRAVGLQVLVRVAP